MDAFVRRYIHENLCYRFVMLPDGAAAYAAETVILRQSRPYGFVDARPGPKLLPVGSKN